ncbi:MAG TPA: type II toxin-antitoxin system prevent-host-death family antitoxin [bacterium]|nr:type II toxin-antitoxin system prevent-host-death family antitoxin [bacterium]
MKTDYLDLRTIDFAPLSEVKAKLSEYVRLLERKRIVLTTNGRPSAVLISYEDYLNLSQGRAAPEPSQESPVQRISLSEWKKESKNRETVRDSILGLFDADRLGRKGQKDYKRKLVKTYRESKPQK